MQFFTIDVAQGCKENAPSHTLTRGRKGVCTWGCDEGPVRNNRLRMAQRGMARLEEVCVWDVVWFRVRGDGDDGVRD